MRPAFSGFLSFALLLSSYLAAAPANGEDIIGFKPHPYPIAISFSAQSAAGTLIFDSGLSETPSYDYDTVLIQGEMPDQNLGLEILIQAKNQPSGFEKAGLLALKRFSNGRFWAKYLAPQRTRQPLKITVTDLGLKSAGKLVIYEVELSNVERLKEIKETVGFNAGPAFPQEEVFTFKITRRAGWSSLPPKEAYTAHAPVMFTLHHTAGHSPGNYAEALGEMQFLQDYHQNAKGWNDIGYHFLISPQGDIFEGRPETVVGAHVKGRNTNNVGISIMGNYHIEPSTNITTADSITPEIVSSIAAVGAYLKEKYSVPANSFYAHRDITRTACPGDGLYARMPEFRSLIFPPAAGVTPELKLRDWITGPLENPAEIQFQ